MLNDNQLHHQQNARFCNKAKLKPIRAKDVQIRLQTDLLDLGRKAMVSENGLSYRYALSVIDAFSRFTWLRPLSQKKKAFPLRKRSRTYIYRTWNT